MSSNTDFDNMDAKPQKFKYLRFDPTVNSGALMQMGLIVVMVLGAYYALKEGQRITELELFYVKANAAAESQRVKESLTEIKIDLKELQRTVNEVNNTVRSNRP